MKKKLSVFLVLVMLATVVLSGCGATKNTNSSQNGEVPKKDQTKDTIMLKYWVPFSGGDGEYMQGLVDEFNETHDDIQVEMLNIKWADYYTKLRTSLVSRTSPDIAIAHTSMLAELSPTGMLTDINTLAEEAGIDWSEFSENVLNATIRDGKYLAVPLDTHALIMYYNKDYLNEAGVLDADGNIIMEAGADGFINMLKKLKKSLPDDVHPFVVSTNNICPVWVWYAFYNQIDGGGSYLVDGKAAFNNDHSKKVLQLFADLINEGLWPKNISDASQYDLFKSGKAAINFAGVWSTGNYEQNKDLNFAAVPIPAVFDSPATWGDSHTFVLPKKDDKAKQVAAAKFADWVTDNGVKWAKAGHIPSKTKVVNSSEYKEMDYRPDYAKAVKDVKFWPVSDKLGACNDKLIESFTVLLNGTITVDEFMERTEKEVNSILAK